jgi:pyruvate-ferredoxin/flavodoxin oxidoreductase
LHESNEVEWRKWSVNYEHELNPLFPDTVTAEAERVVIAMGSGCQVIEEAVQHLVKQGKKVGVLKVHMYRPWSAEHFLQALPATVKRIAVLDRTKEAGGVAEPLYLDVAGSLQRRGINNGFRDRLADDLMVVGGRYGLGSKDFTPAMAIAVFDNLAQEQPKDHFTGKHLIFK